MIRVEEKGERPGNEQSENDLAKVKQNPNPTCPAKQTDIIVKTLDTLNLIRLPKQTKTRKPKP